MQAAHIASAMERDRPFRIVTFTTLYPNAVRPGHGIFVENRLRQLVASGRVTSRVVAPVPWFPKVLARYLPGYSQYVGIPFTERRNDISIIHPRFLVVPKLGMTLAPALLFARSLFSLRRLYAESGDFDLIDAHYFYPDGVAAVWIAKILRKPVVITARGSDINLLPRYRMPRLMIRYAARQAAGVMANSRALKDALVALGAPAAKVRVLRNGVDLAMFRPLNRSAARAQFRINGPTLLSVGNLVELKGHDLIIGALPALPQYSLLIVGDGPQRSRLEQLATTLGVIGRVRFLGRIAHDELAAVYSAADALVLASSHEGWPNVLLEAMACGTPVIASKVGGNSEVVAAPEAGLLLQDRTSSEIANAVKKLVLSAIDRAATRRYAEKFSWDATTEGQIRLYSEILNGSGNSLVRRNEPR